MFAHRQGYVSKICKSGPFNQPLLVNNDMFFGVFMTPTNRKSANYNAVFAACSSLTCEKKPFIA